jgi:hypothetical protein
MTFTGVLLIGLGVVFIASGLEGNSLLSTFQSIINGDTIDWSGQDYSKSHGYNVPPDKAGKQLPSPVPGVKSPIWTPPGV